MSVRPHSGRQAKPGAGKCQARWRANPDASHSVFEWFCWGQLQIHMSHLLFTNV